MGMSVCFIKKPVGRGAALEWLTQDPVWVNTHNIQYVAEFPEFSPAC